MKIKTNKKIILGMLLAITLLSNILPVCKAASEFMDIQYRDINSSILYDGGNLTIICNAYITENGNEYYAYNALYPTYNYNNPETKELINNDSLLYKVVVCGYPYRSIEELGCNTWKEAYTATQMAVYCAHCGHIPSKYSYIEGNEESIRIYNAFLKIIDDANNYTISENNNILKLLNIDKEWKVDGKNIYKDYKIKTNYDIDSYKVEIQNFDNATIVDTNNILKNEFSFGEEFRVILPIDSLTSDGEFQINILTKVPEIDIYLGKSSENEYVLTGEKYKIKEDSFIQKYKENISAVNLNIKEADTNIGIENAIVNLLDENQNIISSYTTNERGQIFIQYLMPGKYYIEQVETEKEYNIYSKQIEINMEYGKIFNYNIKNTRENVQNIDNKQEIVNIEEEIIETNINNETIIRNINDKTYITNETNTVKTITENNTVNNYNIVNNDEEPVIINNTRIEKYVNGELVQDESTSNVDNSNLNNRVYYAMVNNEKISDDNMCYTKCSKSDEEANIRYVAILNNRSSDNICSTSNSSVTSDSIVNNNSNVASNTGASSNIVYDSVKILPRTGM